MTRTTGIGGHHLPNKGRTNDWLTPPRIIQALGEFDLDPCCPPEMPWATAKHMISSPADGLAFDWYGRVWLNPPYGPETTRWMAKMVAHGEGTALIFARTETTCWFKHVWPKATAVLFLRGRLHFHHVDGTRASANAGGPSALVAYGDRDADQLLFAGLEGQFVRIRD
jgi:hypothetical protein